MEKQPTNYEIADIVTLELVNEHKFEIQIQPFIKNVVDSFAVTSDLQEEIVRFQYQSKCCGLHTHSLKRLDPRIQQIVTVEVLTHYWERYSKQNFSLTSHVPSCYYDAYKRKPKKESKQINELDTTEIELRVLAKYANLFNTAEQKVNSSNKVTNQTLEHFKCYKQGRWAWNTLKKEFAGRAVGAKFYHTDNEEALVNLFTLEIYKKLFRELYQRDFNRWDIPPQCRYLFEPEGFEENGIMNMRRVENLVKHDDMLDANTYMWASAQLKEASERRFIKQFKPKEITMLDIKDVTLIDGDDADNFTTDQLFSMIAGAEKSIKKLQEIEIESKAVNKKIVRMKEGIVRLVKIVDERD